MSNEINFLSTVVFGQTWNVTQSKNYKLIEQKGSSRSSKTWSNFQVLFLDLYENPMTTCTILRDTQKSCREIIEVDFVKWLSDPMARKKQLEKKEITIFEFDEFIKVESLLKYFIRNKTNHTWTFKHNSSFIRFTGLDDEDDAMGMTQDICWINEPYKFSHEVYKQLSQRTSKYILFDWNPKQNHWIDIERKKDNTITLHSTFKQNPFCPEESRIQILSYQPVEQCELVLQELLTISEAYNYETEINPLNFSKQLIKELLRTKNNELTQSSSLYHWLVYGKGEKSEKPNKIFRNWIACSQGEFDTLLLPSYFGLDFGLSSPSALVEMKFDGDKHIYYKERMYKPMNEMKGTLADEFENLGIPKHREIVVDSGNELNKQEGIKLMNSGYNVIFAKKGKGSIVTGIELMQKKVIRYTQESTNLEQEYENHSWKMYQGIQLDEPEQGNDHIIDACKYVIVWYCQTRGIG
jgi:phage terminase large subunit